MGAGFGTDPVAVRQAVAAALRSGAAVPPIVEPILDAARRGDDLRQALARTIGGLGFEHFVFARRNIVAGRLGGQWRTWGNYPTGWLAIRQQKFAKMDPVRGAALRTGLPQCWDETFFRGKPQFSEYYAVARSYRLASGVCMVMYQPSSGCCDFFGVAAEAQRVSRARSREIAERFADLWIVGACGHLLLSTDAPDSLGMVGPTPVDCVAGPAGTAQGLDLPGGTDAVTSAAALRRDRLRTLLARRRPRGV